MYFDVLFFLSKFPHFLFWSKKSLLFNTENVKRCLNLVYRSAPLTRCAVCVRRVFGARLITFPRTRGERRTPGAWKWHTAHLVLLVFAQKTKKFWFAEWYAPFVHGAAQVRNPVHTYVHLVRKWFANHSAHSCIRGFTGASKLPATESLVWMYKSHIRGDTAITLWLVAKVGRVQVLRPNR